MPDLATGNITFLYTDIEGSTRLWEQHPDQMAPALEKHDEIWRTAVAGHGGQIFRVTGDGFCASFADAASAVAAAAAAQQALWAAHWGSIDRLRTRAILHTGIAQVHDGDYIGGSLNLAGRLLSVCHGGQTLLSHTTADLVRQQLPDQAELLELGRHRFRDMARDVRVYQLSLPGVPQNFPPLSSSAEIPHNLPDQLSSFIGREQETAELQQLLQTNRLVTLVGPGGTGKTRLSIRLAGQMKKSFRDGVWLVELAPINDPALIDQSIASILGVQEQPGRPLLQSLATYLRRKQLLLLLDNCEHLVDACARTASALLQSCPELRIMASSREGLGVSGESVYPVHPLSLPEESEAPETIAGYEAVRLFLARAALVRPSFTLDASNAASVARICRRLDGIPLAIELAAARIKHLTPQQIAARLDQSFRLLTGGSRAALPRQQTLRALIDWSYDLLSEPECVLFRRLSVFHGGWTLAAAEAVCAQGVDDVTCLDPFDIIDLSGSLVEKSMVELDLTCDELRYKLLETMRQYGLEKLKDAGEALIIRDNHLAYYTAMALEAEMPILKTEAVTAVDRLEADRDNLSAALEWASSDDAPQFINLTAALAPFWSATGSATEGSFWLEQALAGVDMAQDALLSGEQGDRIAQAYFFLGLLSFSQGKNESTLTALDKAIYVARVAGNDYFLAQALSLRSPALMNLDQLDKALASAQESAIVARRLGNKQAISRSLSALGGMMLRRDKLDAQAWQYLEDSVAYARDAGDIAFLTTPLLIMVEVAIAYDRLELAWEKAQEGIAVVDSLRNTSFRQLFRTKAADVYRLRGEYATAIPIYQQAVTTWREVGNLGAMARCIECLAFIEIGRGRGMTGAQREAVLAIAGRLLGTAAKIRDYPQMTMPPYEQREYQSQITALKELLDESQLENAWTQGQAMSLDEAEDYITNEMTFALDLQ